MLKFIGGLLIFLLTLTTPFKMIKMLQGVDWSKSGTGKNTKAVKKDGGKVFAYGASACAICFALLFSNGFHGAIGIIAIIGMVLNLLCIIITIAIQQLVSYKDGKDRSTRRAEDRAEAEADVQHKTAMAQSKAQLKANQTMASAGAKIVDAKMDTAIAQEKAKAAAVKSATAHMAVGAIAKPKEALGYAQASGALAEGKELADKMADEYMGDMAPTVIDGSYCDVTEEAKSVMSDADAQLVEHIKSMTREKMCELLQAGANALMLDTEDQTPEQIADNVLKYAPEDYVKTLPDGLSDFEKAVAVVESSAKSDAS